MTLCGCAPTTVEQFQKLSKAAKLLTAGEDVDSAVVSDRLGFGFIVKLPSRPRLESRIQVGLP